MPRASVARCAKTGDLRTFTVTDAKAALLELPTAKVTTVKL